MAGIVGNSQVVQHHALGKAGGAAGVLDLHFIPGPDLRKRTERPRFAEQRGVIVQIDNFADRRDIGGHLGRDPGHRIAAKFLDQEQPDRAGLFKNIFELARLVAGIDGYQRQPGEAQREFGKHPFGHIGCPDRDPFARPVAGQ